MQKQNWQGLPCIPLTVFVVHPSYQASHRYVSYEIIPYVNTVLCIIPRFAVDRFQLEQERWDSHVKFWLVLGQSRCPCRSPIAQRLRYWYPPCRSVIVEPNQATPWLRLRGWNFGSCRIFVHFIQCSVEKEAYCLYFIVIDPVEWFGLWLWFCKDLILRLFTVDPVGSSIRCPN